jgi:hypothetical protein
MAINQHGGSQVYDRRMRKIPVFILAAVLMAVPLMGAKACTTGTTSGGSVVVIPSPVVSEYIGWTPPPAPPGEDWRIMPIRHNGDPVWRLHPEKSMGD